MDDFTLFYDGGTIALLEPQTNAALDWVDEYLPNDAPRLGKSHIAIEHRYITDIVEGIQADGLSVRC